MVKVAQKQYHFTLVLSGFDTITIDLEDALYEAGCDDALINSRNGVIYLDFDRERTSFEEAVLSAIHNVFSARINAKITSIEPSHLVTISDIARRSNMERQAIHMYISGERGPGNFPSPVLKVEDKSPLWLWSDVADWLHKNGKRISEEEHSIALCIESFNAALTSLDEPLFKREVLLREKILMQKAA